MHQNHIENKKRHLEISAYVAEKSKSLFKDQYFSQDELCYVVTVQQLLPFLKFLRDDQRCGFNQLMDICGVDFPDRVARFEVVYNLMSMVHNRRIRVKVMLAEDVSLPSVTGLFSTAGWFEREVFDMYGICFDDHPDLRRILTDYGFEGHPLRKDFPLTGFVELRYDQDEKRVVYEPVSLRQDFRRFDFMSPWNGMSDDHLLPGDEKADEEAIAFMADKDKQKAAG